MTATAENNLVVIADTREPDWMLTSIGGFGVTVLPAQLDAGDYCFFAHEMKIGIERKTSGDFLNSLRDGRMVAQSHKLLDTYDAAILLREGGLTRGVTGEVLYEGSKKGEWLESGWAWDSVSGMSLDLMFMGIMFHHCMMGDAAREIVRIVGSLSKDEHKWIRERTRPNVMTIDRQYKDPIWSLAAWTGLGVVWAEALMNRFVSFDKVITAPLQQLCDVTSEGKKLGAKRATKLYNMWRQKWT